MHWNRQVALRRRPTHHATRGVILNGSGVWWPKRPPAPTNRGDTRLGRGWKHAWSRGRLRLPLALLDSIHGAPAFMRTEALQGTSPLAREGLVVPWPVAGVLEKNVPEGYPRALVNRLWPCGFAIFDPFPVAPALASPLLFAGLRFSISLLCLPS
jgi:hypothetical protein